MSATYDCIATSTLGSTQSSVTFSTIPQTFTDLRLIVHQRNVQVGGTPFPGEDMWMRFNGDAGSNYSSVVVEGYTSPPPSVVNSNSTRVSLYSMSLDDYVPFLIDIQNYSNTTTNKTVLFRNNAINNPNMGVSTWRSTSAITSITLTMNTSINNFRTGSTFALYGIKAE